jgi:hypothetical protein
MAAKAELELHLWNIRMGYYLRDALALFTFCVGFDLKEIKCTIN